MSIEREPAFPFTWEDRHGDSCGEPGLTKLEYFACDIAANMIGGILGRHDKFEFSYVEIAEASVGAAKALIAELEKHND